jgi:hypothetical protein
MTRIRIRKQIDSETLTLSEIRPFIGRTMDIVIEEPAPISEQFWAYAAKQPTTEAEFAAQQEQFRCWRSDPSFEAHWPMIDRVLVRDFEKMRQWDAVNESLKDLKDYDYDVQRDQDACDLRLAAHARNAGAAEVILPLCPALPGCH